MSNTAASNTVREIILAFYLTEEPAKQALEKINAQDFR